MTTEALQPRQTIASSVPGEALAVTVNSPGQVDAAFDYTNPPRWRATMLEDDQRKFPRSAEHLPDCTPRTRWTT
jgi:hypothetical protein